MLASACRRQISRLLKSNLPAPKSGSPTSSSTHRPIFGKRMLLAASRTSSSTYRLQRPLFLSSISRSYSDDIYRDIARPQTDPKDSLPIRESATNFVPQQPVDFRKDSLLDQSMTREVEEHLLDPNHPDLLVTRYRGFSHTRPASEVDVAQFSALEQAATEAMYRATRAKDVHTMREEAQRAREIFEAFLVATDNYGASSSVLFHLGLMCKMLKDWSAAAECFPVALHLDAELVPAKLHLADALQALNRHPEAVHYYDEYFNDYPRYFSKISNADGMMAEGMNFALGQGEASTASNTSSKSPNSESPQGTPNGFKLDSEALFADVVFSRGRSYFAMGQYGLTSAKEDFKAVVRLGAKHKANALYYLGLAEHKGGDHWKALKYFDLALQTGPAAWYMYKGRADAWTALGKEERAADDERIAHALKRKLHFTSQVESTDKTMDPKPEFDMKAYLQSSSDSVLKPPPQENGKQRSTGN